MAREVDAVHARFTGDTRDLDEAVRRSQGRVEQFRDRLRTVGASLAKMGAAAGVAAGGIAAVTNRVLASADAIGKAANAAGVTTTQIQTLRFAFGQLAGTSDQQVDVALQRFNRTLGMARQGSKEYADALGALNVSLSRDTPAALEETLRGLAAIEGDADRAAIASRIFGEEVGPRLAAALADGITAVSDLRAQLERDGGIISEATIRKAEKFNDEMDRLSKVLTAELANTLVDNADALDEMATALAQVATWGVQAVSALMDVGKAAGRLAGRAVAGPIIPDTDPFSDPLLDPTAGRGDVPIVGGDRRMLAEITRAGIPARRQGDQSVAALLERLRSAVEEEQEAIVQETSIGRGSGSMISEFDTRTLPGRYGSDDTEVEKLLERVRDEHKRREELEEEHKMRMEEIERNHSMQMLGLSQRTLRQLERFQTLSWDRQASTVAGALSDMTAATATESKAMFELNKAAALANAALDAREAVTGAYKVGARIGGPPLGAAFAAAAGAAQAAQISAIAGQSFGSGVAPSVGSTPAPPVTPVDGGGNAAAGGGGGVAKTLTVRGIDRDSLFDGASVRRLAEQLLEFQRDGGRVVLQG
ncbi:MAG: hypothetical protein V2J02_19340 [Pseudomonadales bacterium]|jgi:hypothetical protein|nr:hypothetical protein [Pseudomonadales bacterium]